jgi:outer membrane immunogenic protein
MNKTVLAATLALAAGALAPSALAQAYAGAGYTALQIDASGDDVELGAITARFGYEFNPFLAIETEASFGVSGDDYSAFGFPGSSIDVSLEHQMGIFAVGRVPLPIGGKLFGRVGHSVFKIEDDAGLVDDGTGLAYGGGVEFDLIPKVTTRFEYTQYSNDQTQALSISGQIKF